MSDAGMTICEERGYHESAEGFVYLSNPPSAQCDDCGAFFRASVAPRPKLRSAITWCAPRFGPVAGSGDGVAA